MKVFWLIFFIIVAIYVQTRFWTQPSIGDRANWDYMAQVIARGGVPYRDVVNIKSPFSAYIGAAAIVAMQPFKVRDVLAIRIIFILLAALTVAVTFLVVRAYFDDFRAALLAATIMVGFHAFVALNGGGIQPKTPMILFGLFTLYAIACEHPLIAGVMGMLSALSWQPGLLFVGVAGLAFSRYLTSWRDMKAVKLIAGAFIPLCIALGYFWISGALRDLYAWTIDFNARIYAPTEARSLADFFEHLSKLVFGNYQDARIYFYLAIAGVIGTLLKEALGKERRRRFLERARGHAIVVAAITYFAFCMIDIQGAPDLIPLLPFVAAFAAIAIMFIIRQEANLILRLWPKLDRAAIENFTTVAVVGVILVIGLRGTLSREIEFPTLHDQDVDVQSIVSNLQPGDKIFVHGRTEILELSGLTNASKHFLLDRGKDRYLDIVEPGGFDGWLQRLKADRPKVVVLDRPAKVDRLADLEAWVKQDYELRHTRIFDYWIRNEDSH